MQPDFSSGKDVSDLFKIPIRFIQDTKTFSRSHILRKREKHFDHYNLCKHKNFFWNADREMSADFNLSCCVIFQKAVQFYEERALQK